MMTRDELLEFHQTACDTAKQIMAKKNNDYAGGRGTVFANFERVEALGICSTEQGFLVRMADKLSRLATYAEKGKLEVQDETVHDTLLDMINYSILLGAYLSEKAKK